MQINLSERPLEVCLLGCQWQTGSPHWRSRTHLWFSSWKCVFSAFPVSYRHAGGRVSAPCTLSLGGLVCHSGMLDTHCFIASLETQRDLDLFLLKMQRAYVDWPTHTHLGVMPVIASVVYFVYKDFFAIHWIKTGLSVDWHYVPCHSCTLNASLPVAW